MSKTKKNKQKKKRRQKRTCSRSTARSMSQALHEGLVEADRLDRQRKWGPARELLEDLDRRYPRRVEVLNALVNVYYELDDMPSYQYACQRLAPLRPHDPDVRLMLAGSCIANIQPALALRNFRLFLQRWPEDVRADDVRKTVADLEDTTEEALKDLGLAGEDGLQLATLHEEILCALNLGKYDQVRTLAEQLLKQRPDFLPALNNLGEAHFRQGRIDRAMAAAQRVLEIAPENFHALANLTRYFCTSGRTADAASLAARLKSVRSEHADVWVKKAEALNCLGDDQGVLDAYEEAQLSGDRGDPSSESLLEHLTAVAAMRLGRETDARRHWKRAIKQNPGLSVAEANLKDLKKPVHERHAPWAYDLDHWVPRDVVRRLASRLEHASRRKNDKATGREVRRFLESHPQVAAVLPVLLDRGDPDGREFALRIAVLAETPESLAALRDFALSQRGPDDLRSQAVNAVQKAGLLPAGPVRIWMKGEWKDLLIFGFEIHEEATRAHGSQVESWASEASHALSNDELEEAESLLKQALQVEPDAPDLLNNLANAYRFQGRIEEWRSLIQQIHQQHPDYLFGRLTMALLYLDAGDIDRAREMIEPLLARRRFHRSEFAALCGAQIELFRAEGNIDSARSWLDMWKRIDPHHPGQKALQRTLTLAKFRWPDRKEP